VGDSIQAGRDYTSAIEQRIGEFHAMILFRLGQLDDLQLLYSMQYREPNGSRTATGIKRHMEQTRAKQETGVQ
jgi:hypothetical protein